MSSWRWELCTLERTKLFQVLSNDQHVQHVHSIYSLSVEGPFSDEVGSSRAFWRNCPLAGCVGAFSQLRKCFSKLLAIDGFTTVKAFPFFNGKLTVVLFERSFVGEESGTPLVFVLCSFYQTFHWLLSLSHLPVSRRKHGFELIIGYSVVARHCCWLNLKRKKSSLITKPNTYKSIDMSSWGTKKETGLCET